MGGQQAGFWQIWKIVEHLPGERQLRPPLGTEPPAPFQKTLTEANSGLSPFWHVLGFLDLYFHEFFCARQGRFHSDSSLTFSSHGPSPHFASPAVRGALHPPLLPWPCGAQHQSRAGSWLGSILATQPGLLSALPAPNSLAQSDIGQA